MRNRNVSKISFEETRTLVSGHLGKTPPDTVKPGDFMEKVPCKPAFSALGRQKKWAEVVRLLGVGNIKHGKVERMVAPAGGACLCSGLIPLLTPITMADAWL